jgi:hypothetical protein
MGVIGNKSRTGMTNSPEMRKHISEALMGSKCGLGNKSRTGQKRTPEEIAKQSATAKLKGRHCTEEHKQKLSELKKGKPHPSHNKVVAIGKANKGRKHTTETRNKMSQAGKGRIVSEATKKKIAQQLTGKPRSEAVKQAMRNYWLQHKDISIERGKAAWKDPIKVKTMLHNMGKARGVKPNKLEFSMAEMLSKHFPDEWEYVGDGRLIIGKWCPDFVRNHGNNQLIELFGDYWHRGENPQDRIDLFKQHGYDTIVIWQSELKKLGEVEIIKRVSDFMATAEIKQ